MIKAPIVVDGFAVLVPLVVEFAIVAMAVSLMATRSALIKMKIITFTQIALVTCSAADCKF